MKITRNASKLSVSLESGIGYYLTFTHDCGSDANAEAWRVHCQTWQDDREATAAARIQSEYERREDLRARIKKLERANAALRGHIRRMKGTTNAPA